MRMSAIRRSGGESGFTLLELLIVIALVSAASAASRSIPNLRERISVERSARALERALTCGLGRMLTGKDRLVTIDASGARALVETKGGPSRRQRCHADGWRRRRRIGRQCAVAFFGTGGLGGTFQLRTGEPSPRSSTG